ncbi:hypothetical protein [Lysobacter panacisoli]|uniref:HEAT repeat domain-containing protein n=1 Tax=Lysobacter panacisoli TaxID=1255263 RepID=A0ABP9L7Y4_9GAMM|nr:hypothetical protein [Lysobacter panacisoli]
MDLELRLAALSKLIDTHSEAVDRRLGEEFRRAEDVLLGSSEFDELSDSLKTLAVLAPRFHMALLPILKTFARSVPSRTLTHGDALISRSMLRYRSAETLVSLAIDVSKQIRYLHTEQVVDFMLELSRAESTEVQRKAEQALEELAEFNLDIFYERRQGASPQDRIVSHFAGLDDPSLTTNSSAVLRALAKVLSPSMEGHSWTYSSMTIRRGSIVSDGGVAEMRERAITLLKRMYMLDTSVEFRQKILRTMDVATRREHPADNSETSRMFDRDAISVLEFRRSLVTTEALPLVQTIEHQTYWDYYHAATAEIEFKALQVRDELASHAEYQIYKQLIGFEGIFGTWEKLRSSEEARDYSDNRRRIAARQYVNEIDDATYDRWLSRILEFSKTRSNDLATFPVYYEFLESVGREKPRLALELVTQHEHIMSPFLIPLLRGLWTSEQTSDIESIVDRWIADGTHLAAIAKSLYKVGASRLATLEAVIARGVELDCRDAVLETVGVASSLYAEGSGPAKSVFMHALRELAKRGDARWISVVWFSDAFQLLVDAMTEPERVEALASLTSLPELDYQAEEILSVIAEKDVEAVLDYLISRLKRERELPSLDGSAEATLGERFEAIPYQLQKLDKHLARVPDKLVSALRREFDESPGLFTYRGARLIEATFPDFSAPLEQMLLKYVESGKESDIDFVLAILRTYDGPSAILDICKAIIKAVPQDSKQWNEVAAAIESTGVVSGEYGLVNAYEQKRAEVAKWLNDDDGRVQAFAKWLIEGLDRMIDHEKKRADEGVALRKYKFGADKDET